MSTRGPAVKAVASLSPASGSNPGLVFSFFFFWFGLRTPTVFFCCKKKRLVLSPVSLNMTDTTTSEAPTASDVQYLVNQLEAMIGEDEKHAGRVASSR